MIMMVILRWVRRGRDEKWFSRCVLCFVMFFLIVYRKAGENLGREGKGSKDQDVPLSHAGVGEMGWPYGS